jgi:phage tail-like protein
MALPGAGLAFALAAGELGVRLDPFHGSNFVVEIEGILSGQFSEVSGLQAETEIEEYAEGGLNSYVHRFAGRTKHSPLQLKHGLTLIDGLWWWHQDVIRGKITRRNGTIYLLTAKRIPVLWWNFKNAFPSKWVGPSFHANSSEVAFESIELAHEGLSRPFGIGKLS